MQFINKSFLLIASLLILISCNSKKDEIPNGILTKDEMISILIDVQLADATVNLSNYGQANFPNDKQKLFALIYSKHKVSKKKFEDSFVYYTNHPETFEKIYDEVINGLSRKQAELSK
jgi:hypothetical protein